jgi:hypothetical protein
MKTPGTQLNLRAGNRDNLDIFTEDFSDARSRESIQRFEAAPERGHEVGG